MSTDSTTSTPFTTPFLSTPWEYGMVVFTVLIAVFGTAANSISLSYFVNVVRFHSGTKNNHSSTKLFAALNLFDLLVSLTSTFEFILWYYPYVIVWEVFKTICMISIVMTGFLTCVLAVVRMIGLLFPLYIIHWRAVTVSTVLYSMTVVVLRVLYLQKFLISDQYFLAVAVEAVQFSILAGVYLIVVLVNVISMVKLYFSKSLHTESRDIKRRATITVMIISIIYCVCNIGMVVVYGALRVIWNYYSMPMKLIDISYFILLPLNSACNPVVYLVRKEEMRSHVRTLFGRLAGYTCRKEEQAITGVDNGARCDTSATAVTQGLRMK